MKNNDNKSLDLERYKAIIQSSNDAIIGKDLDGIINSWNQAAEELYGYTADEALGKPITLLFPKNSQNEFESIMDRLKRGEKIENYETMRVTKNKDHVEVSVTISPIKNNQGTIVGASAIARNITKQKRNKLAKEFLISSGSILASSLNYEETLKNIANLAVPHIADWCSIDVIQEDGKISNLVIAHKDPSMVALAQKLQRDNSDQESEDRVIKNILRTNKTEFHPVITRELIDKRVKNDQTKKVVHKLGMTSAIIAPLTAHGKTFGTISFILTKEGMYYKEEDCSFAEELARRAAIAIENARLYEQLQLQNEELEEEVAKRTLQLSSVVQELKRSNQDLEDFAKVASHDLTEPLRKINTFASLLDKHLSQRKDEKTDSYLDRIISSTRRMQTLIEDLLSYSKVSTGKTKYDKIDLNQIVTEVLDDLEVTIEEVDGKVKVDELPSICADSLQMRQVFQNLISNAIKFHKPDEPPKVRIYSPNKKKSSKKTEDKDGEATKIVVEDNGIGFDEKYKEQIFTIFERLHGKRYYQGTGIGLAVVQKIITNHGGKITARSKPNEGSEFIISLPKDMENSPNHLSN